MLIGLRWRPREAQKTDSLPDIIRREIRDEFNAIIESKKNIEMIKNNIN